MSLNMDLSIILNVGFDECGYWTYWAQQARGPKAHEPHGPNAPSTAIFESKLGRTIIEKRAQRVVLEATSSL